MAQIREIKKRIGAVGTISRITKTMQMIATAKFTAAGQRASASKPYAAMIDDMVRQAASKAEDYASVLIDGPAESSGKELMLVIASDRGLCGAYNANILRTALNHKRESNADVIVEVAGKKGMGFFRFQKIEVNKQHVIGDTPKYEDVEAIATEYLNRYLAGEFDAIRVCSMRYVSTARQHAEVTQLLPLSMPEGEDTEDAKGPQAVYEFSPSAAELLDELLPTTVRTLLFQLFNEAAVSEHVQRMIAMKAATENANDFGRTLKRDYNRARQSMITTELMEVISGAAALE
ncbi:MAG: ATP synthase F1 subunit gamma [Phycisphaerales bacterium]|nr:ATP synthase F1 subunit gamma [Phycisphaerales bacterium]